MAVTPSQRMGPSPGAAPPMHIAASWSRPVRSLPNTSVLGRKPKGRAPLGRPIGSSSSIAAGNKPTARGLTTIAPYKFAPGFCLLVDGEVVGEFGGVVGQDDADREREAVVRARQEGSGGAAAIAGNFEIDKARWRY